jgi:hypothetical protein
MFKSFFVHALLDIIVDLHKGSVVYVMKRMLAFYVCFTKKRVGKTSTTMFVMYGVLNGSLHKK